LDAREPVVLAGSKTGRKRFPNVVGHLAKCGNAAIALALVDDLGARSLVF
jgi:hypothetical protein